MTTGEDLLAHVEGVLHEETQVHGDGIDLTVAEVYEVDEPGRVDFGGGELEEAALSPHGRTKRSPDDDYAWWHLDAGGYAIEYNERLDAPERLWLATRPAVLERGAFHPTLPVGELPVVPLSVGGGGIRLKENARVSTLRPRRRADSPEHQG